MKPVGEELVMQRATAGGTFPRFRNAFVRILLGLSVAVIVL
jgi:hypothetical protein